jgi:predicted AAA+ superfamily ATPase
MPGLFDILRGIIDERRRAGERFGHFLLLGSASLDLMQQSSETLAGRVAYLDIGPIQALEWTAPELDTLWLRGGFPDSLLAANDGASLRWREDFVRSYLERDVPMFGPRLPAQTISRLWTMLAHQQGALLQQSRLASGLGVSSPAVDRYIDLLVDLQIVRRLRPWSGNIGKRLVKAPKLYVRDSGLVHALLGINNLHDLAGHPVCGPSYEGFCIDNLLADGRAFLSPELVEFVAERDPELTPISRQLTRGLVGILGTLAGHAHASVCLSSLVTADCVSAAARRSASKASPSRARLSSSSSAAKRAKPRAGASEGSSAKCGARVARFSTRR